MNEPLQGVGRDVRRAWRSLARARMHAGTILVILGLCVGANTAVFSLLHALVLRALPLTDPERLVEIWNAYPKSGVDRFDSNVAQYLDYRKHATAFSTMALFRVFGTQFPDGGAVGTGALRVTPDFFAVLDVRPLLGRFFQPEQTTPGHDFVLVLTQSFWESYYQGDAEVIGRTLQLGDDTYVIVGVAPRALESAFRGVGLIKPIPWRDAWIEESSRHGRGFALRGQLIARMRPGVSLEQARVQLRTVDHQTYQAASSEYRQYVDNSGYEVRLATLQEAKLGSLKRNLFLVQAAALFVLLIGGVNVAALMLARAHARQSEFALRRALGASSWIIVRQLVAEAGVLAAGSTAGAIVVAFICSILINRVALPYLPAMDPVAIGIPMLVFGCVLATTVTFAAGVLPVVHAWRADLMGLIRQGTSMTSRSRGARFAASLIVCVQVATSMVLLTSCALLLRSFARAVAVPAGIAVDNVVTIRTGVRGVRFETFADIDRLQDRILEGMARIPGVHSVALATHSPTIEPYPIASMCVYDEADFSEIGPLTVRQVGVSPGYFDALGISLLGGRTFDLSDDAATARPVIIDRQLARMVFGEEDPLGRRIAFSERPRDEKGWWTIIGVVASAKYNGLDEKNGMPFVYLPVRKFRYIGHSFFVRSARDPGEMLALLREEIVAADPLLPPLQASTLGELVYSSLRVRQAAVLFTGIFAGLAVVLSAVGLYGVLAYDVGRRVREIGIRGAIGASRRQVLRLFLKQGILKSGVGIAIGVLLSVAANRLIANALFEVSPFDAATYIVAALFMFALGIAASLVPAWRAARINPAAALRAE